MKHFIRLLGGSFFLFCILPVGNANAQAVDVKVNMLNSEIVYLRDFDLVALEFDIQATQGEVLNTLTVASTGTARPNIEFDNLKLWVDDAGEGFQGWGFDKDLAIAVQDSNVWVFNNIDYVFTDQSEKFFVSFETGDSVSDKSTQFVLQDGYDQNDDGIWKSGDRGIFLDSGVIQSLGDPKYSKSVYFKSLKADSQPPKGYIHDFDVNDATIFINPELPMVITGEARDRTGGIVTEVKVYVGDKELIAQNTGTNFSAWKAEYTPTNLLENHEVYLRLKDGSGYAWNSPVYDIIIDQRQVEVEQSILTTDKEQINDSTVDIAEVTVILNDSLGDPLSSREVTFESARTSDSLSIIQAITNNNGEALTNLISNKPGQASITVKLGETVIGTITVEVVESTLDDETNNVSDGIIDDRNDLPVMSLIKGSTDAVYYFDNNGGRHVFVTFSVYQSWFGNDFSQVLQISDQLLASIPLKASVTYHPGQMITSPSMNEVYLVDINMTLRHITNEQIAKELFNDNWNKKVHDMQESLLFAYNFGEPIVDSSEIDISDLNSLDVTIESELY